MSQAMKTIIKRSTENGTVADNQLLKVLKRSLQDKKGLRKVLLIPQDNTRAFSKANTITNMYYRMLEPEVHVDLIPALGTHMALTDKEISDFFGDEIPKDRYIHHNWRTTATKIGEVPQAFVNEVSNSRMNESIDVDVHKSLVSGEYDLIISIGRVTPHEVMGMGNYSKNIFVGIGGAQYDMQDSCTGPLM